MFDTPYENAEKFIIMFEKMLDEHPMFKSLYYTGNFKILPLQNGGTRVALDKQLEARFRPDDKVCLAYNQDDADLGEVPVLSPVNQESFGIALMYIADLDLLNRRRQLLAKLKESIDGNDNF